ncbi:hypothetical protein MTR67_008181 [Solanum verrucosum]|uniref:Integrase catalytic domain-containing protein n=1 Tax=Solanum verrucosum TaxID=315347 RepID=A0AAF0TDD7_SOLVR|nr:hypothetical protein MTR67_008181 [Solanum verrucosum]
MQFHFEIEYKKGRENKAADLLSRVQLGEVSVMMITPVVTELFEKIKKTWETDPVLQEILTKINDPNDGVKGFSFINQQLRKKGKLVVGNDSSVQQEIIQIWHEKPVGGHFGIENTYKRISSLFYWKGLKEEVTKYVRQCATCQRSKYDSSAYPGLLQPLKIPSTAWSSISMDFIDGLPKSKGKSTILVVVDRLTKYGHFLAISHPYTAASVAQLFLDQVYKLHGMPENIISDRDPIFMSKVWQDLFSMQGVTLSTSTAYHPQTDGQTEVLNRTVETFLRCFCCDSQKNWASYLSLAEWWYNTTFHSAIQTTPYEALYGRPPPIHIPYVPGEASEEEVDRSLITKDFKVQLLKFHISRAQQRMASLANQHRTDRQFSEGDWVYLKIQPYRQLSISNKSFSKLSTKYYGPYQILQKVGPVAYKLLLPPQAAIHHTFHVSQLKPCYAVPTSFNQPPTINIADPQCMQPQEILERRMIKRGNKAVPQVLVQWSQLSKEDATWEDYNSMKLRFPDFIP